MKEYKEKTTHFDNLMPSIENYFLIDKILDIKPPAKVLEIGVGNGKISNYLNKLGFDVYGVDNSKECLKLLNPKVKKFLVDIEMNKLPFKDNMFDVVLIFAVLEHIKCPENVLKEINRVLKSKGKVYASTPNINWFPFRLYFLFGMCPEDFHTTNHVKFWNLKRFKQLFRNSGFEVIKQITSLGFPNPFILFIRNYRKKYIQISGKYIFISSRLKSKLFGYNQVIIAKKDS